MGAQQSKDELLYKEVQNGNIDAVKDLHRAGASLEWRDKEGRTPLVLACTRGDLCNMVAALLEMGANVNYYRPGSHNGTPLHHAAKRGLDKTVMLLLSYAANPMTINDDCQTALEIARIKGHVKVVRLIEGRISLFSGMIRELSGPTFLGALAPNLVSKKVWAVVLPSAIYSQRQTPKFELVIYPTSKVAQPRTVISLSKVEIEEPKFSSTDPLLLLFDKKTKNKYRFLAEKEGDKKQIKSLLLACRGQRQNITNSNAVKTSENISVLEDEQLAMAISASLQSALHERIPPASEQSSRAAGSLNGWGTTSENTSNRKLSSEKPVNGRGSTSENTCKSNVHPDNRVFNGWSDNLGSPSYNGWGPSEPQVEGSRASGSANNVPAPCGSSIDIATVPPAHSVSVPSAPPMPVEYAINSSSEVTSYPSVDPSPVEAHVPIAERDSSNSGTCVICWDAPAEAVCIPCGHVAGCTACLDEVKNQHQGCPVCRATIEQVIKVYLV